MTSLRIFLVEDDNVLARTTEWRIEKLGYEFAGRAASGDEAIRVVAARKPDIILMDINLQGEMDGILTARIIKKDFDIPVIFLTSCMDKETIALAKTAEPRGYLVKPFENKDLMAAIELAVRTP